MQIINIVVNPGIIIVNLHIQVHKIFSEEERTRLKLRGME